ncbi:hypothetical protein Tsubulata_030119 [Turnera subulata]|uniref:Uncharacterized protein n=1 Tax=Turnera subulata TaxID=218843 RepID=A0A9Q0FXR9_9ROSI|nr:hypothetical protein Tsubulata_030119 [Turnera subulata]
MGFAIAKCLLLLHLSLLCFTVFGAEEFMAVAPGPTTSHHGGHGYNLHPATAPAPAPHHHHHRHHGQPPIHATAPSPAHHHHHHHAHPPAHAPVHAPVHPPMPYSHPPAKAPVHAPPVVHPHPPAHPPRPHFDRTLVAVQGVVYCKSCKYGAVDTLVGASPLSGATVKLQCNNTKYPLQVKGTTDKNGYFYIQAPKTVTNYAYHKCKVSLLSSTNATCSKPTNLHGGITGGELRPEKKFSDSHKTEYVLFTVGPFAFNPKCPR